MSGAKVLVVRSNLVRGPCTLDHSLGRFEMRLYAAVEHMQSCGVSKPQEWRELLMLGR